MRNFLQFIIPILLIFVVGILMLIKNNPKDDTKRLYIKCNSISKNYEVFSGNKLFFAENNDKCKLDVEIVNVDHNYIRLRTDYLWGVDKNGEINKKEAKQDNIIQINEEVTLYSHDEKTKYVFAFK